MTLEERVDMLETNTSVMRTHYIQAFERIVELEQAMLALKQRKRAEELKAA